MDYQDFRDFVIALDKPKETVLFLGQTLHTSSLQLDGDPNQSCTLGSRDRIAITRDIGSVSEGGLGGSNVYIESSDLHNRIGLLDQVLDHIAPSLDFKSYNALLEAAKIDIYDRSSGYYGGATIVVDQSLSLTFLFRFLEEREFINENTPNPLAETEPKIPGGLG